MATPNTRLPSDCYKVRILETKKGKTEKGDYKLVHEMEFCDNPPLNVAGESVDINGLKVTKHSVLTEKALRFFNIERQAFRLPPISAVSDFESIDVNDYKGAKAYALCSERVVEKKNDVTDEVIKDPYTGKPMIDYYRQIDMWIVPPSE